MKDKLLFLWHNISPKQKRTLVTLALITAILALGCIGYFIKTKGSASMIGPSAVKKKEITLDAKLLEKSAYLEGQKELAKTDEKISLLRKELDEIRQEKTKSTVSQIKVPAVPKPPDASRLSHYPSTPPPPPPAYPISGSSQSAVAAKPAAEPVSDIEMAVNMETQVKEQKPADLKKNSKQESIYLPPSFMEATLLSGLDAPTVESAKGNPVPVLMRIKDLAVLPNRVKADLKGCFIIAEGQGNLADERAHLRLVNLSCLSKRGQAVIDQKIKGFVVDSDGKIGLRGTVVSRMGSAIARSVLAGFFGGIGDAVRSASTITSTNALGTTQTLDPEKIGRAGLGSGLAQGAQELQKFYLELAKQSMPVIEVGATRNITLVVSEGLELEIKEQKVGGNKQS